MSEVPEGPETSVADGVSSLSQPSAVEQRDEPGQDDVTLLKSKWQFASCVQFCRIFAEPLSIRSFSADQLEAALCSPDSHRVFLQDLLYKLTRPNAGTPYNEREADNWEVLLSERVRRKWQDKFAQNPLAERDWFSTDVQTRLMILHALCDWRTQDCTVTKEAIRSMAEDPTTNADTLRHTPIGEDSKGARYFSLSDNNEDCRLYREQPPPKGPTDEVSSHKVEGGWETVCTSIEELQELADSFAVSEHEGETALHDKLASFIIPRLNETAGARKRMEDKAAALESAPRKRSSRIQVLSLQKEEADRKAREEEEERRRLEAEHRKRQQDWEREQRLLAKQKDHEDRRLAAIALQQKLSGLNSDGLLWEERMARRAQDGSGDSMSNSPEPGGQGESGVHGNEFEAAAERHIHKEEEAGTQAEEPGLAELPQPQPQHSSPQQQQQAEQQQGQLQAKDESQHSEDRVQGLQQSDSPEPQPKKREHPAGWTPLDFAVPTKLRKLLTRPVRTFAPMVAVAKGRAEMAPGRSCHRLAEVEADKPKHGLLVVKPGSRHRPSQKAREMDIAEEDEEDEEEEAEEDRGYRSGPRAHLSRRRPSRKKKEMDDIDYEEEEESDSDDDSDDSEEGYRPKSRSRRAQALAAANAAKAAAAKRKQQDQHQRMQENMQMGGGPSAADLEYQTHLRRLQEEERMQLQTIMTRFPLPHQAREREHYQRVLQQHMHDQVQRLKERLLHMKAQETNFGSIARMGMQQTGYGNYSQASLEAMAAQKAARERQRALQQQQVQQQQYLHIMQLMTPQQRSQIQRMPQPQQVEFLERMRQQQQHQLRLQQQQQQQAHLEQQRMQQQLQQQVFAQLSEEQKATLRQMPRHQQQEALAKLTQQVALQQEQHRSQMMQQQMQSSGMMGGIFSDMQSGISQPRISSPAINSLQQQHSSPALRTSSGAMSGGSMGPMLRQSDTAMAMEPSLPKTSAQFAGVSGGQRWAGPNVSAQQMPLRFPGMIPNADHGAFPPVDVAHAQGPLPSMPPGIPPAMQGQMQRLGPAGSPHILGGQPGMAPTGWATSRPTTAALPARMDVHATAGLRQGMGSPSPPLQQAQTYPLPKPATGPLEPGDPHLGDEFGDLDSMLAGDAFNDQAREAAAAEQSSQRQKPEIQPPQGSGSGSQAKSDTAAAPSERRDQLEANHTPAGVQPDPVPVASDHADRASAADPLQPQKPNQLKPQDAPGQAAAERDTEAWTQLAGNHKQPASQLQPEAVRPIAEPLVKLGENPQGKPSVTGADLVADASTPAADVPNGDA